MARPVVSVILPTYNEAENIPVLLERLAHVLESITYEIIVVDDNSPDRTWEIADAIAAENPRIRVVRRLTGRGLSSAVVAGMSVAAGRTFAVMDADLQHDEAILGELVAAVDSGECDIAIGSRGSAGGSYGDFSRFRRFLSWGAASLARLLLPVGVKDPMSGYFVVSRRLFKSSADRINPVGFKILLEFIGRNPGIRIKEIGYTFRLRKHGETKLSGSVMRNYLLALYDMRFGRFVSARFAMYSVVGSTGVLVNLLGERLGSAAGLPVVYTGLTNVLDPLFLSVPFGIQLSIISNYVLNNYITFYEHRHRGWRALWGFTLFEAISSIGVLVQWGVFQLLHVNGFLTGVLEEDLRRTINNMIGIVVALIGNYFLNVNFTWKRR